MEFHKYYTKVRKTYLSKQAIVNTNKQMQHLSNRKILELSMFDPMTIT